MSVEVELAEDGAITEVVNKESIDNDGLIDLSKQEGAKIDRGRVIYCHFSFRRPKGKDFGYFAVSFYRDYESTVRGSLWHLTRKYPLWLNQQFVPAIQAYWHALLTIYEVQGILRSKNVSTVMLVTDNSALAGWIENPRKNRNYYPWMEKAVSQFRMGGPKELILGVGLCGVRKAEKAYKYCQERYVENDYEVELKKAERAANKALQSKAKVYSNPRGKVPSPMEALLNSSKISGNSSDSSKVYKFELTQFKSIVEILNEQEGASV